MNDHMQAVAFYGGSLLVAVLFGVGLWYGVTSGAWDGPTVSTSAPHIVGTNR